MTMVNPDRVLAHTNKAPAPRPLLPQVGMVQKDSRNMGRRLTEAERWERRSRMAALQAEGKYLRVIAEEMGVSISVVSKEIDELVKFYQAQALDSIQTQIAREDALIYMVQLEAIDAWHESKYGKVVHNKKKVREIRAKLSRKGQTRDKYQNPRVVARETSQRIEDLFADPEEDPDEGPEQPQDGIEKDEEYTREESSPGNPEFLRIILDCHKRRADLHSLYPKADFNGGSGVGGGPGSPDEDFNDMTPNQRAKRLASLMQGARLAKAKQLSLGGDIEAQGKAVEPEPTPEDLWNATAK